MLGDILRQLGYAIIETRHRQAKPVWPGELPGQLDIKGVARRGGLENEIVGMILLNRRGSGWRLPHRSFHLVNSPQRGSARGQDAPAA